MVRVKQTPTKLTGKIAPRKQPATKASRNSTTYGYAVGKTYRFRQIHRYQKSAELSVSRPAFQRLVWKIVKDMFLENDLRFQTSGIEALHEASEEVLVTLLEDMKLARRI